MTSPAPRVSRTSKRSAVACSTCHDRKVRCTVAVTGAPCASCMMDGAKCEVLNRKRRRNMDLLPSATSDESGGCVDMDTSSASYSQRQGSGGKSPAPVDSPRNIKRALGQNNLEPPIRKISDGQQIIRDTLATASSHPTLGDSPNPAATAPTPDVNLRLSCVERPSGALQIQSDAGEDSSAYAETLEGGRGTIHGVPFYPGDCRGPAFLMDICEPHRKSSSNHCIVSLPSTKSLPPEDADYLKKKGALSLPPPRIVKNLLRCYFHHVHPFSPILDPYQFILEYEKGHVSLLLLWSMFVASASFIDENLLTCKLFSSRMALKRAVYDRAKALYDAGYESDKVTLIQSVFLMSHWYTSSDDRFGPWHWNGIAISLAHTIGLHRLPTVTSNSFRATNPVWRRLWWSIYCREAWLSLGQGRPMRVSLEDSETALPGLNDKDSRPCSISDDTAFHYLPRETDQLFDLWMRHAMLGISLGTILSTIYRAKAPRPTRGYLESAENEIRAFHMGIPSNTSRSRIVASHYHQFQLYLEAAIIVIYRPFILDSPKETSGELHESWKAFACQKTRVAATNACNTVSSMMADNLMGLSHTLTVLALIPAMQIHLFELTSSNPMLRQMGKRNLSQCMLAMEELGKSYISAISACKLFETAVRQVENRRVSEEVLAAQRNASVADEEGAADQVQPSSPGSLPQGYLTCEAGVITNVWAPWTSRTSNQSAVTSLLNDVWMGPDLDVSLCHDDISNFFSSEWAD